MKMTIEWNGKKYEIDDNQRVIITEDRGQIAAILYMPGLPTHIIINLSGPHPAWNWNGDAVNPTFSPSILTRLPWGQERQEIRNHVFVRNGMIQYLGDCTHEYAGKTIELPRLCDWPDDMKLWEDPACC